MKCTPVRCTPMRYTPVRCTPVRYTLVCEVQACICKMHVYEVRWGREKLQHYNWPVRGWKFCRALGAVANKMEWPELVIKASRLLLRKHLMPRKYRRLPIRDSLDPLVNLIDMHLIGVHLRGVRLIDVYLIGVYLTGVNLIDMHPMGVYLTGVRLIGVHFTGMYLTGVHLTGCGPDRYAPYGCVPHRA